MASFLSRAPQPQPSLVSLATTASCTTQTSTIATFHTGQAYARDFIYIDWSYVNFRSLEFRYFGFSYHELYYIDSKNPSFVKTEEDAQCGGFV